MLSVKGRVVLLVTLLLVVCAGAVRADFFEGFTTWPNSNWRDLPGWETVNDGVLTLTPPNQGDGCWITSNQTFTYGTYKMRFRTTVDQGNYIYMGYFSRSPWAQPAVFARTDGGKLVLSVSDMSGGNGNAVTSSTLAPNVWHTVTIIRRPDKVVLILDGALQGEYTSNVPTTALPIVIDCGRNLATPLTYEIDEISVTDSTTVPDQAFSFFDGFDAGNTNWWGFDSWTTISNGVLNLSPPTAGAGCWISSYDYQAGQYRKFGYGTYTVKFQNDHTLYSYGYLGYASRDPWMTPSAMMRNDSDVFLAALGSGPGMNDWGAINFSTPGAGWHTLQIVRKPTAVGYFIDGRDYGEITNPTLVPTVPLPVIMDFSRGASSTSPLNVKVDYVGVSNSQAKPEFHDGFDDNPDNYWSGMPPYATFNNGVITIAPTGTGNQTQTWYKMGNGTLTCKFKLSVADGNFAYFGCGNRSPESWMNPCAFVRFQYGRFYLVTGDGVSVDDTQVVTPVVTANVWHTMKIVRRPGSVSVWYDGQWVGTSTKYVPSGEWPLLLDTYGEVAGDLSISVDDYAVSNEIYSPPVTSMDSVKKQADGAMVSFNDSVVSWALDDVCYVEKADRSSGIRVVKTAHGLVAGDKVLVSGQIKTDAGINERFIDAYEAVKIGDDEIKPLAINNKAAGGSDFGTPPAGQAGVAGGVGLNNIGLLVRMYGRVSAPFDAGGITYYSIDDGAGTNTWVLAIGGDLVPGQYVGITGVMSAIVDGSDTKPLLLVKDIATSVQAY